MIKHSLSTFGLLSLGGAAYAAVPLAGRADDVVVSAAALVAAAKRLDESTVVLRVTRSGGGAWLGDWIASPQGYRIDTRMPARCALAGRRSAGALTAL